MRKRRWKSWFTDRKSEGVFRPNIILILLDQYRNDARDVHSVFQELGKKGVLFSNLITHAPYTLASMHAMFTGLYGRDTGVDGYTRSGNYDANNCLTIVQYLQDIGYYTRGYTFSPILFPHTGFDVLKIIPEDEEPGIVESHVRELTDAFASEKPFFQFLHYGEIHHTIVKEVLRKYSHDDDRYFGNIAENQERYRECAFEAAVYTERLIDTIDSLDPLGETIIVVMTDHGGGVGEKKGEKAYGVFAYDYSICVWAYFLYPNLFPPGKEIKTQIRSVDILPTLLDILDFEPSKKHKALRGQSLMPIIRGEESADRIAFTETGGVEGPHPSPDAANVKCLRDGKWKLIYNSDTHQTELYNVEEDPEEMNNLRAVSPEKTKELWLKLSQYL